MTDNRNVHGAGSRYEALDPGTARRSAEKVEWHDTPRHGRWLSAAACAFAVPTRPCRSRRTPTIAERRPRVEAWEIARNERRVEAKWPFTTAEARIKRHRLYPSFQ